MQRSLKQVGQLLLLCPLLERDIANAYLDTLCLIFSICLAICPHHVGLFIGAFTLPVSATLKKRDAFHSRCEEDQCRY